MSKDKRVRKERMKRNQQKRGLRILERQLREGREQLLMMCAFYGHDFREVSQLGNVCIRCGLPNKVLHADAAMPPSAEPLSGLESVPAVESDTQPRW